VSKSNVHPDHYKVGGRDRQDDAAAPRLARAKAAKATSQKRPDRMAKKPWFQRPDATGPAAPAARPGKPARKESRSPAGKAKLAARKKTARTRTAATRKTSGGARRSTKRGATPK
jgi:hypothetical protein